MILQNLWHSQVRYGKWWTRIFSKEQLAKNIREFASNTERNTVTQYLKEVEIVLNSFKNGIFSIPSKKSKESDQSWSPELYGRTSITDFSSKTLWEHSPFQLAAKTSDTTCIRTNWSFVWKSDEQDSASCWFIVWCKINSQKSYTVIYSNQ